MLETVPRIEIFYRAQLQRRKFEGAVSAELDTVTGTVRVRVPAAIATSLCCALRGYLPEGLNKTNECAGPRVRKDNLDSAACSRRASGRRGQGLLHSNEIAKPSRSRRIRVHVQRGVACPLLAEAVIHRQPGRVYELKLCR